MQVAVEGTERGGAFEDGGGAPGPCETLLTPWFYSAT
jgi:hypothetical protein